ncbi:MAG: ABC transporter ATP-binding protein [Anaerolineae bacterium]|nr:ABC transporter ATP-binding protein [Anaerolineae bacterium]
MTSQNSTTIVQTRNLRKVFQMGRQKVVALAGVDVDIPAGSFTVIMGPSGSGKSTLLYLMGGLDRPTSGSILVNGTAIEKMDENDLAIYRRKTMGFIFQSFNLISSMSAQENAAFPMRFAGVPAAERQKRAFDLLKLVGLEKRAHHKPTELSGGQQQRVAVARALVNNPGIILADEPTGNLDTSSGLSVMHLLSDLHHNGRTLVVVTHDPRMVRFATHVIYLLDGSVVTAEQYHSALESLEEQENSSDEVKA